MSLVTIDIVADIACPWCAIGFARLEQAISQLQNEQLQNEQLQDELTVDIRWHPFELNPATDSDGEPVSVMLSRKYGRSPEEVQSMQDHIQSLARGLGLNFDSLHQRDVRNTFNAHRLVKWAGEQGRATAMKKALFEAYFGHNAQITDSDVLATYAEGVGLNADEAKAMLVSDRYVTEVREEEAHWQQVGISSVPGFIINDKYLISGAQEPEAWVQALRNIVQETDE